MYSKTATNLQVHGPCGPHPTAQPMWQAGEALACRRPHLRRDSPASAPGLTHIGLVRSITLGAAAVEAADAVTAA